MSHLFSGALPGIRIRALAASALVLGAIACNPDDTTAPTTEPQVTAPTATQAVAQETPAVEFATTSVSASAVAPGVPFGDFHLPTSMFKAPYSGSLWALWPSTATASLNTARSTGMRVVVSMAGSRKYYTNSNKTFNMTKWKKQIDQYKKVSFSSFVSSGVVIGHYLVDEPYCPTCWGGTRITYAQIEEMSRYSKAIWPSLPTGVRSAPSQLGNTKYKSLDFAWAQWEGPLHVPSYKTTAESFRDREIAAAKKLGLGLVFGLNYLDAGDGSSHINGTYAKDPNPKDNKYCPPGRSCYRYAMSAAEVKKVGTVFAQASFGCAVLNWHYDATFIGRSGMKDAISAVSSAAKSRSKTSCVQQ